MTAGPPHFPIVWADPDDAKLSWRHQKTHWPVATPRLSADLYERTTGEGFSRRGALLERAARGRTISVNGHVYVTQAPLKMPEDGAARHARSLRKTSIVGARVAQIWRQYLPEVEAHLDALDTCELGGSPSDLIVTLELTIAHGARLWEIHGHILFLVPIDEFGHLYAELFPDDDSLAAFKLLSGEPSKTVEAATALARIARTIRERPELVDLITRASAEELLDAVTTGDGTKELRRLLVPYLETYGKRCPGVDPALPSLIEDPSVVIRDLRAFVLDKAEDPATAQAVSLRERARAEAETLARLDGYPGPIVDEFRRALAAARDGTRVMETHNFYIDHGFTYRIRRVVLALGRALAAGGKIELPEDVFHFALDELRDAVLRDTDIRACVADRRAELQAHRALTPPATIGKSDGSADAAQDPRARSMAKFAGEIVVQGLDARVIRGHPGSSGRARGTARIVGALGDAGRVTAGDVLVTATTAAPWTPLFATVAAVVTDAGGVLSHSAIVAREYRIPAVVGCGDATVRIPDGALVEVDGDLGVVRLL